VPNRLDADFHVHRRREPSFAFCWHRHDECELTWIVRGHGWRCVGDAMHRFADGDCCLLGPGLPHTWDGTSGDGDADAIVVQFPAALLRRLPGREAGALSALLERASRGLVLTGTTRAVVTAELLLLVDLAPGPERLGRLIAALGRIAAGGRECRPIARHGLPTAADGPWGALVEHLHAHLGDAIAQSALARRLRLSPSSFARAFRRRFGCTFSAWRRRLRLARAAQALVENGEPVAAVAAGCGFQSLAHFNRAFKAAYDCTPRGWRSRG